MIVGIAQIALLVRDYDEAKAFYGGILGFSVVEDTAMPEGKRWVRLRAPGKMGSELLLSKAADDAQRACVGKQAGGRVLFFLNTDDFDADHAAFLATGVEFVEGPFVRPYGKVAIFKDLYGNRIDLIEPA